MESIPSFILRQFWPAIAANRIGERLPGYLEDRVLERLGLAGEGVAIEKVATGGNAVVRRWATEREGVLYIRAWPFDAKRRRAREHRAASELFTRAGVAVPRIVLIDDSFTTMRRWRIECAIEAQAPGLPIGGKGAEVPRSTLDEIARQLARLHGLEAEGWGKPWRPVNERADPHAYWADRVAKLRSRVTPERCGISGDRIRRGLDRLQARLDRIELTRPVLIHGDLNGQHLFMTSDGIVTWIDFGTVHYGLPEQDLADVRSNLCAPDEFDLFLEIYRDASRSDRAINMETLETVADFKLWEKLASRIKKRAHRIARGASESSSVIERLEAEQRKIEERLTAGIEAES